MSINYSNDYVTGFSPKDAFKNDFSHKYFHKVAFKLECELASVVSFLADFFRHSSEQLSILEILSSSCFSFDEGRQTLLCHYLD